MLKDFKRIVLVLKISTSDLVQNLLAFFPLSKSFQLLATFGLFLLGAAFGKSLEVRQAGEGIFDHTRITVSLGERFLDLRQISHPAATSGPFDFGELNEDFTFDVAGRVDTLTDASGTRDFDYQNGRLTDTNYTAGELNGYTVRRLYGDNAGRQTGLEVVKDGAVIHSQTFAYNGSSRELSSITGWGLLIFHKVVH